jgi:hypothetical protein
MDEMTIFGLSPNTNVELLKVKCCIFFKSLSSLTVQIFINIGQAIAFPNLDEVVDYRPVIFLCFLELIVK